MSDLMPQDVAVRDDDRNAPPKPRPMKIIPRARREKAEGLTGKIPPRMIELIERKIYKTPAGATIREIAAYVQQRMGSDQSPEGGEAPSLKTRRQDQERKEIQQYSLQVAKYLKDTYGEEIKDPQGFAIGYGQQVAIHKETGHVKRRY